MPATGISSPITVMLVASSVASGQKTKFPILVRSVAGSAGGDLQNIGEKSNFNRHFPRRSLSHVYLGHTW